MKQTPKQRAILVMEIIELSYVSLLSHLEWTHRRSSEGFQWHKDAVKDYAKIIERAARLY